MTGTVRSVVDRGIATIEIDNRPVRNALDLGMYRLIARTIDGLSGDGRVRVVVVRGAGEEAFSAGGDISEFRETRAPGAPAISYNAAVATAERALESCPVPVIAQIHGACVGGGCGIALACDLRIADTRLRIGVTAARIGLVYGLESTRRLVDAVGRVRATRMLVTARLLTADEALSAGLVDEIHAPAALEGAVRTIAAEIASLSSTSIRGAKSMLRELAKGVREETPETVEVRNASFSGDDYVEGVQAFLARRAPRFCVERPEGETR
ncbi:enoyl-CoA hydratase/isomerase family protein [Compostimonas suwonensis]|uniref:Enoyl-CoA hydratase/carnithine racemase n=1 Tax=Compostimonas suwonensis TaxID=1048394 RepID=A0A2M9BUB1_9MICO|nr:enoyl-CoA hydratase-related protein [Compostimonas suwonensis]PJJ61502.1 enoyl-CoA hydratase/carnithine racemase [Compostimonas suwonensis]